MKGRGRKRKGGNSERMKLMDSGAQGRDWVEEGSGEAEEATGGGQGLLLLLWASVFAELSIALGNVGACNF